MATGTQFSPTDVMMGRSSGSPYLWMGPGKSPGSVSPITTPTSTGPAAPGLPPKRNQPGSVSPITSQQQSGPAPASGTVGPSSIRATGSGPFDQAYRQNLATYAGGQFSQPVGGLSFNPTDISTFPGQPTGGGTAPVTGMPSSLLDMALGGQGFSWTPPQPAPTAQNPGNFSTLQDWMDQFLRGGSNGRMGSIA